MSDLQADAIAPKPYGLLGLVVSIVLILLGTVLLSLLAIAAAVLATIAVVGYHHLMDHVAVLDPANGDLLAREKFGIVVSLIGYGALALAVLAAARVRGGARGWRPLVGWNAWTSWRAWWIWGLALVMVGYSLGATVALAHFFPSFDATIRLPEGKTWGLLFLLLASVLAPIGEEMLFRGWMYTSLRASFGVAAAMLVVSVLFALAHWEQTHLYALAVFPVGLGLAWIRERTDTIKASIVVHGLYNGIAALLLFFQK
ncbi:putative Abortive infection protein [Beijerinckiaceae bacterium RH AL1]|nr:CPBP family intramembrane metalloprotease [Beijerinckiaceae bacterium]VVB46854.1 putative Abortive infection protein [Beijerinckiaceae bacterium RH CH11]VVB46937.1 putative Abortive infection protein [Beijerinckiaceae bacterium RH AL8]VVC55592.1 putative Abortive infection protein [Beijerinckiaceae bacterium RH AL1]